ncbi:MAG: DsbA family oxidoreductase [Candidatus Izemoplasmatales bacterium]|nr:DsbA family oxidoreductase [Bacilli bacterium]MDD3123508.1 DsbA family oxidoreductase [Candidatus Izemoplasmatales bacterium]
MKIEVWSDFACPFCYIGKKNFENALTNFKHKDKVEVVFKAYQLNPNAPKIMKGSAYESFASSHNMSINDAKKRFQMFTENAKKVGLVYDYDHIQMTNTFDAHRIAKWANTFGKEQVITDRFMKAYFSEGKNLADFETLLIMVKELGLDFETAKLVLSSNQYEDVVKAQMAESKEIGVQGVPFFVINRKYGVSGAQPEEYFSDALNQIWSEDNPLQTLGDTEEDSACTDESCSI